jgi:hypothetical protein
MTLGADSGRRLVDCFIKGFQGAGIRAVHKCYASVSDQQSRESSLFLRAMNPLLVRRKWTVSWLLKICLILNRSDRPSNLRGKSHPEFFGHCGLSMQYQKITPNS